MGNQTVSQLDKVLALADSMHEAEALVAVRKARQMLLRDGLSFSDLARAANKPRMSLPFGFFSNQHIMSLEAEVTQLRQRLEAMRQEQDAQQTQAQLWRQRAEELEQKLGIVQADAERWRQLARETVDKLWDLGQAAEAELHAGPR